MQASVAISATLSRDRTASISPLAACPVQLVKVGNDNGSADWEGGNDRQLTALGPDYGLKMACKWNQTENEGAVVDSYRLEGAGEESPAALIERLQVGRQ